MDRQQVAFLSVMSGAFLLMVMLAFVVGGIRSSASDTASSTPIPADKPLKKLRAKPGAERENARALLSFREEAPDDRTPSTRETPPPVWGSLESGASPGEAPSRDNRLAHATPEEALQIVLAMSEEADDEATSRTERSAALGFVLARQVERNEEAVERAFRKAKRSIVGDDDLQAFLYFRCKAWLITRNYQAIHDELAKHSSEWLQPGARSLEIGMMRAFAEEHLEQEADAEVAYRWVMEAAHSWQCLDEPRCEGIYRQAARRLSRLYRKQGLNQEAVATTERMRVILNTTQDAV